MNLSIVRKNHAANSKIGNKIDFRHDGTHESHPTAWELINRKLYKIKEFDHLKNHYRKSHYF